MAEVVCGRARTASRAVRLAHLLSALSATKTYCEAARAWLASRRTARSERTLASAATSPIRLAARLPNAVSVTATRFEHTARALRASGRMARVVCGRAGAASRPVGGARMRDER